MTTEPPNSIGIRNTRITRTGSVVIESVFSYPGIGLTMTNAIVSGDYPVVLVTTLIIAAAMLICSFMVDVLNALLDPRVRLGE